MSPRPRRMRSREAAFLYYEKPQSKMHSGGVALLDRELDFETLQSLVVDRIAPRPGFDSVVQSEPFHVGHPSWRPEPGFDPLEQVARHVMTGSADSEDLFEEAGHIFSTSLDRSRPLWEVHLVDGHPSGRSALVLKIHRALLPEIGSASLLEALCTHVLDDADPVGVAPSEPPASPVLDRVASGLDSATGVLLRSIEAGSAMTSERTITATQTLIGSMPDLTLPLRRLPFNSSTSGASHITPTTISFAEVRAIRRSFGGGVRDVLLTAIAGAVGRFAQEQGQSVARRTMRVAVPVRVRATRSTPDVAMESSVLPVNVPIDIEDPKRRLRAIRRATRLMAAAKVPEWIAQTAYIGGLVPPPLQASLGALANGSFSLFNMTLSYSRGPQIPLSIHRSQVTGYTPFAPVGYGQGFGCAVYNYNQQLHIGLTGDRRACPELARIRDFFDEEVRLLKAAAGIGDIEPIHTGVLEQRGTHDSEWR